MEAFHRLVDRHASYLYGLALSLLGGAADAEDAVQETLKGAFDGLRGFREQSAVKTWLTRILIRQVAHTRKRRRWLRLFRPLEESPEPTSAAGTDQSDVRLDVRAAILALRQEYREVITLRELEGFSYQEIAQVLGIPQGTVESRLFRARRELQGLLAAYRQEEASDGKGTRSRESGHE
jgi:RNA polymerase sigma-70 factor (ECF subfamily)